CGVRSPIGWRVEPHQRKGRNAAHTGNTAFRDFLTTSPPLRIQSTDETAMFPSRVIAGNWLSESKAFKQRIV
ncbi:MAG: hypothetical protein Q8O63_11780, partial [Hoeflea sp.]|nr:hypothetical protein [Hoeflea sp.]